MPTLLYYRDRVTADLKRDGATADIAERLAQWQPTEDDNGLRLVRDLVHTAPGGDALWRLDIDNTDLVVSAAFSCDEDGLLTYNGELTLSMMIDARFEIADTGLAALEDLTDFTEQQDGQQRLFHLLDAITAHLNTVLSQVLRFSQPEANPRSEVATPQPPSPGNPVPTFAEIAAQMRRDIAFVDLAGFPDSNSASPQLPLGVRSRASAEQLITLREKALGRGRDTFRQELDDLIGGWINAGCPAIAVESITPAGGAEHDTEIILSNGLRLLVNETGVQIADTRGRRLHFHEAIDTDGSHEHLDLEIRP
ncbi:hypothetical protein ACQP1G_20700 [Nocardia sp. CA-107356]|uniref:hypothetical protein n=1 Tax=Nocardia sp. CA-107356 TaxID=3239972 RepID=UPI003D8DED23